MLGKRWPDRAQSISGSVLAGGVVTKTGAPPEKLSRRATTGEPTDVCKGSQKDGATVWAASLLRRMQQYALSSPQGASLSTTRNRRWHCYRAHTHERPPSLRRFRAVRFLICQDATPDQDHDFGCRQQTTELSPETPHQTPIAGGACSRHQTVLQLRTGRSSARVVGIRTRR